MCEKMKKSRFNTARKWLIFWTMFVGNGAVWGAACMLIDPTGKLLHMDAMLPYFKKLPFADLLFVDYTFSGIALLIFNGLTNLTAAGLLLAKKKSGVVLGSVFGVILMLWICIQFYMFPANVLSTAYFIFGFAQTATGYAAWVFGKQEAFTVNATDYPHIGTNPNRLVVYFSRMGYVKKVAYETANRTGAEVYEIQSTERTVGTPGFWWCGRFGMHRWEMSIEPIAVDLEKYDYVTICSPIWVFALAAPVRSFCRQAAGRIKEADYIVVHFSPGRYKNVAAEMDTLLGVTHTGFTDVVCRVGRFETIREKIIPNWGKSYELHKGNERKSGNGALKIGNESAYENSAICADGELK